MSDFYQNVVSKYKGSPASVVLFVLALAMFAIGVNHFVEDTYSSYYGLLNLEARYSLNVQIFKWSYATMSLAPQVASIVFFYLYLADRGKKWLGLSFLSQCMDFFADAWYRGNGLLLEDSGVFFISSALTFIYFSVGSEMFVTVGGGLLLKMIAPALAAWKAEMKNISLASKGGGGQQTQPQPQPKPVQFRPDAGKTEALEALRKAQGFQQMKDRRGEGVKEPQKPNHYRG